MPADNPIFAENAAERAHLKRLTTRLSDADLLHPMPAGWTVGAVLVHLAFWDKRALVLIQKWQKEGVGPSLMDTDVVNEVTRTICLAVPPRAAVELALSCASAIDQAIEQLSPSMIADIETNGKTVRLNRATHRGEHLREIEQALGILPKA